MQLDKLTTLLVVEAIEPCLPAWEALGYTVAVRVPEKGTLGFVILKSKLGELMLQTKRSLAEDLPDVAARRPTHLLYADVSSLTDAKKREMKRKRTREKTCNDAISNRAR